MSAIILEILKNNPEKIFTQTEIIDEIEKQTGKRKSKSAISQNITTLSNRNKINYEKGLGRTSAKISLKILDIEKPKPIKKPKPKPIKKPKPKPIEEKPKIELVFEKESPDFNDYQLTALVSDKNEDKLEDQLSQAEKTLSDGIEEFNNGIEEFSDEIKDEIKQTVTLERHYNETLKTLATAKETIINQNKEITNLEVELAFAKGIKKRPFTFKEFSDYMLSQSEISGSNSMKIGEIAFRKSDLKNFYLLILYLREESKL